MYELVKMDETTKIEHAALRWADDDCYFLLEFFPGQRFGFSRENDLIKNIKRPIDRCGGDALRKKEWAIQDIAQMLEPSLTSLFDPATTTFVPVPPSRTRTSVHYDPRVATLLRLALPASADMRELIVCREEREPAHYNETRPSAAMLYENYRLGEIDETPVKERIVIFDDIVTSGNHFAACKRFLIEHFPGREIVGVFVARRVLP